ncbi:MAG: hypothetical protein ABSD02_10300 [Steroidobacteraceae bacterium]|jgi:hypothetical protein
MMLAFPVRRSLQLFLSTQLPGLRGASLRYVSPEYARELLPHGITAVCCVHDDMVGTEHTYAAELANSEQLSLFGENIVMLYGNVLPLDVDNRGPALYQAFGMNRVCAGSRWR